MGSESSAKTFFTPQCSFLRMILVEFALVVLLSSLLFLIIRKLQLNDVALFFLIVVFIIVLYGVFQASIMLYSVTFSSSRIQLDFYFFFCKKTKVFEYDDIKLVLSRPKHRVLSFYTKRYIFPISTSLNRKWAKNQLAEMVAILLEHRVRIEYI